MSEPKRHHWVPLSYLLRFASEDRVWVRWRDAKSYPTNCLNVAVEGGFYDVAMPDGTKSKEVEHLLSEMESSAESAFQVIDETMAAPGRATPEREAMSVFLALQITRTPEQRQRVLFGESVRAYLAGREITRELVAEYLEEVHLGFKPAAPEVAAAQTIAVALRQDGVLTAEHSMAMMFDSVKLLAPKLLAMEWCVEHDRKGRIMTSDTPLVVWRKPAPRDAYEGVGIDNAQELRFPLDPTKQLVLTHRPRPSSVRITSTRTATCNQDLAYGCHNFIVAPPRDRVAAEGLDLPPRRPVLRFHTGPLLQRQDDGTYSEECEVLHTWVPRR
jgi:hypothetical protein